MIYASCEEGMALNAIGGSALSDCLEEPSSDFVLGGEDLLRAECSVLNPDRRFLLEHVGFDRHIVHAQGHLLRCREGVQYLDFLAQYGAVPFGHNSQPLVAALLSHLQSQLPSLVQPLLAPIAEMLARRLVSLAPGRMARCTYVNSGAEAVEASIKLARARTGRQVVLSTYRGYHGKTMGALSATDNPAYREPFHLCTSAFERVPFDDLQALAARLERRDIAAFIVEPVQGEGGMRDCTPGYLGQAARLCREHGTLFIVDEVQTGLGRTGSMFASDGEFADDGCGPDVLLVAKALGGGLLPLGAMLCTQEAWSPAFGMYHSSTFANNQLACAVGLAVLDMLEENDRASIKHAARMGGLLQSGLDELVAAYPKAFLRRTGRGLMQGLVLAPWTGEDSYFAAHASARGYAVPMLSGWLLRARHIVTAPVFGENATLRLEPSLTIEPDEIERVLCALREAGELIQSGRLSVLINAAAVGYVTAPGLNTEVNAVRYAESIPARAATAHAQDAPLPDARFAFLIHPTDDAVLFDTLPSATARTPAQVQARWRTWMDSWFEEMYEPAPVYHLPHLKGTAGASAQGWLIAAPLTPQRMLQLRRPEKAALMNAYLQASRQCGAQVVGLGAFTSVITRGGEDLLPCLPADDSFCLTSGNSLTALSSAESLLAVMAWRGRHPADERVGIVGATGSIGRLAAMHLARRVGSLVLFGNPGNPASAAELRELAGEVWYGLLQDALKLIDTSAGPNADLPGGLMVRLAETLGRSGLRHLLDGSVRGTELADVVEAALAARRAPPGIQVSLDLRTDVASVGALLSASGAGRSIIDPAWLARGTLVCDVARPLDVMHTVRKARPDVFAFEGGLMRLPEAVSFGRQNVLGYPRGFNLACLSETVVLAMEGIREHHSIGRRIDYQQALWVHERAQAHGFSYAVLNATHEPVLMARMAQEAAA